MIKDKALWEAWEAQVLLSQPPDFRRNMRLLESMYEHARSLGVFPVADPLEGLETEIKLATVLNVRTTSGTNGSGA